LGSVREVVVDADYIAVMMAIRADDANGLPRALVEQVANKYNGVIVQQEQGASLFIFSSVDDAFSVAVLRRHLEKAMLFGADKELGARSAIDIGDVKRGEYRVSGRPVDTVLALVGEMRDPGIAVTAAAVDLLENADAHFEDRFSTNGSSAISQVQYHLLPGVAFTREQANAAVRLLLEEVGDLDDLAPGVTGPQETLSTDLRDDDDDDALSDTEIEDGTVAFVSSKSEEILRHAPEIAAPAKQEPEPPPAISLQQRLVRKFASGIFERGADDTQESERRAARATVWRNQHAAEKRIEEGNYYEAISIYRRLIQQTETVAGLDEDLLRIRTARRLIERRLLFSGFARLSGAGGQTHLRPGSLLQIGRCRPGAFLGVDIGYELISRSARQTQIAYEGDKFLVEDLGSLNGTFCDDRLLETGERFEIDQTVEIALGGSRTPPRKGLCRLRATRIGADQPALLLKLASVQLSAETMAGLDGDWENRRADTRQSWLFFPGSTRIGSAIDCAVRLPDGDCPDHVGEIECGAEGFTLMPLSSRIISVDGVPVCDRVPLRDGAEIGIGTESLVIGKS
jgi:hypothetical protein